MNRIMLLPVLLALLIAHPHQSHAEQQMLYYILDGSGSMWGRSEGKMKIQIAKDVMSELITDMPAGLPIWTHRLRPPQERRLWRYRRTCRTG